VLEVLRAVDLVACEDTRTTRTLLAHHGITADTIALHEHNERKAAETLIAALRQGKSVALVSDAGTPGISDPGAWLVAQAHSAGIRVSPIPGPNAAVSALSASGFPGDHFLFAGFLPASRSARLKELQKLRVPWPVVLYEAPHRIAATVTDLIYTFGPQREACIARELTKKFEEVARLPLGSLPGWIEQEAHREQGEFVIVVAPGEARSPAQSDAERVLAVLLEELAPSEAARLAARITGLPKGELYRKALERRK
jgi:16S rRNA (cytidine1402-2'-O)-methyltransferase